MASAVARGVLKIVNFAKGHPDADLIACGMIAKGFAQVMAQTEGGDPSRMLNYCPQMGGLQYRRDLAAFITRQSHDGCTARPENLLTVSGVSHGLGLAVSMLTQPGDEILVVCPCYFLACDIFKDTHVTPIALTVNSDCSFSTEILERTLDDHPKARLVYLVPSSCNPTGRTVSAEDRKRIVEICAERRVFVLADEVYHFLDWSKNRPARMVAFDREFAEAPASDGSNPTVSDEAQPHARPRGTVVSVSSFTKTVAPGLRY